MFSNAITGWVFWNSEAKAPAYNEAQCYNLKIIRKKEKEIIKKLFLLILKLKLINQN